ncbi:FAD-binding oxidoreductase [Actinomadura sediminis]|uniref:FAD-binding oxidoreductase n=1 Tax=Actinomadura sediminis TaxID=1038904 RepID=A0ABW3EIZ7_9ACTN
MSPTENPPAPAPPGTATVRPGDPRYPSLLDVYNHRFGARPEYVRVAASAAEVAAALREAVAAGKRVAVRGGGHCFEDFASSPDIEVLLDVSPLSEVSFDERRRAFAVGAGATLGHVYRTLFTRWGVTIPGGTCFDVGMGGHVAAGGYGHLSRRDGLVVDHLYAVEVVVVDAAGEARAIVATREPGDPHRDLWWAHTGGGGGSFGVVTRYWFRVPDARSGGVPAARLGPGELLPAAPARVHRRSIAWSWDGMTEDAFAAVVRNFAAWHEANSAPDTPAAHLWSNLVVNHRSAGSFGLISVIDEAVPRAAAVLDGQYRALTAGTGVEPAADEHDVVPWWSTWMPSFNWPPDPAGRYKNKSSYLRRGFTGDQLATAWSYLTDPALDDPAACLVLSGYGGRIGAVAPDATASRHRDAVLKAMFCGGRWDSPELDDARVDWIRRFYRDVHAGTGGVPAPGDGAYIGYPDVDLADPEWNTSGVPWHALYYGDGYARLQDVKRRYDPLNVFRHALSVRPPK